MVEEEAAFYMAIQNPKDFRRELLGSSKVIIQLLQHHESIRQLREEKVKLMYEFSKITAEIRMLSGKLKGAIPQTKLRNIPKSAEDGERKKISRGRSSKGTHPGISQLQSELAAIEEKLGSLK